MLQSVGSHRTRHGLASEEQCPIGNSNLIGILAFYVIDLATLNIIYVLFDLYEEYHYMLLMSIFL